MKKYLAFSLAAVFLSLSSATFAAQALSENEANQLRPAGTVSASGARNLDDLEDKLAEKAREEGAKGYVVDVAGGNNLMYGTATIYK